jgi:hypothetical protein
MEREILVKVAARFARETDAVPPKSSNSREPTRPLTQWQRCAAFWRSPGAGNYAWLKRAPSARARRNQELAEHIRKANEESRETYGSPRIHAELKDQGE